MASRFIIVGLGEALFDVFVDAEMLGGAPLNVAVHAHQLARSRGGAGVVVSRVGQDDLGRQVKQELDDRGIDTQYLQFDPDHDTGRVYVGVDELGEPDYDIVDDVAWDWLQFDPDAEDLARQCDAVCFGTLGQRTAQARNTIYRFLETTSRAVRLYDVNLRQDYYNLQILRRSCELATAVKLNNDELPIMADSLGLVYENAPQAAQALLKKYDLKQVILTRGEQGTTIYTAANAYQSDVPLYTRENDADHVGAGDAASAAILTGLVLRKPMQQVVEWANHAGAYVASQPGATPTLPQAILDMVG